MAEEPSLNVDLSKLFVNEDSSLPNDFMDTSSDDTTRDKKIVEDSRSDWASEIDRDNDNGKDNDPSHNPAQSADFEYKGAMKQADGFRRKAAREDVVARVSARRDIQTLTGATVHLAKGDLKTVGRVIAVGDKEFCVLWQDKKASIEKKADYHLVPVSKREPAQGNRRLQRRRPAKK